MQLLLRHLRVRLRVVIPGRRVLGGLLRRVLLIGLRLLHILRLRLLRLLRLCGPRVRVGVSHGDQSSRM